ncbi:hypothetical protein PHMEG_00028046 [Phytophthora megakarya]|uniref:Uncharacterized protein n=1 Tax=Phytophthora megakarya TaxID=4795 RepID=A0A225V473_9STRA|nr:hypothetical protein PHMEG_00028046 [Phytophthora megakarya]
MVHGLPVELEERCTTLVQTTAEETQTAFIKYYCAQFNQTAETRYYSAKKEKEHLYDDLNRLHGYARNAGIQFDNGGRKTCGDRGLKRSLCHIRVSDTHKQEDMSTSKKPRKNPHRRDLEVMTFLAIDITRIREMVSAGKLFVTRIMDDVVMIHKIYHAYDARRVNA